MDKYINKCCPGKNSLVPLFPRNDETFSNLYVTRTPVDISCERLFFFLLKCHLFFLVFWIICIDILTKPQQDMHGSEPKPSDFGLSCSSGKFNQNIPGNRPGSGPKPHQNAAILMSIHPSSTHSL